jgi:N-acetylglucosamine-6-phosphate deacetylase
MSSRSVTGRDPTSGEPLKLIIEDGRIQTIASGSSGEATWLSPGLIDLQVNGYCDCDLNADSVDPDVVISLAHKLISTGVTTFIPTIITASEESITGALRAIAKARRASPLAAHAMPFVHVEGPHISPEDGPRGAHPREHIRPPSLPEFERWQAASGNLVGMVTVSPHWKDAPEYISTLAAKGVRLAIGHTHATPSQIHAAADAGATLSTHLGNGVADPLPRHPNLVWAQLAEDRLTATFIADGHHLPPDTLKAMLRAKGVDRSILVSDAVALAGMPAGVYDAPIGGRVELRSDGRLNMIGTQFLAGAARPLKDGIANVAGAATFSLGDAIRMTTGNPGRFVGGRGLLRPGADADLIRFDWDGTSRELQIETVLVKGEERQ